MLGLLALAGVWAPNMVARSINNKDWVFIMGLLLMVGDVGKSLLAVGADEMEKGSLQLSLAEGLGHIEVSVAQCAHAGAAVGIVPASVVVQCRLESRKIIDASEGRFPGLL